MYMFTTRRGQDPSSILPLTVSQTNDAAEKSGNPCRTRHELEQNGREQAQFPCLIGLTQFGDVNTTTWAHRHEVISLGCISEVQAW
jgi:hypothetical protein